MGHFLFVALSVSLGISVCFHHSSVGHRYNYLPEIDYEDDTPLKAILVSVHRATSCCFLPRVNNAGCAMTRGTASPGTTYVSIVFSYPQHSIKEKGTYLSSIYDFIPLIDCYPRHCLLIQPPSCCKEVLFLVRWSKYSFVYLSLIFFS